jgi:hypothetical protein
MSNVGRNPCRCRQNIGPALLSMAIDLDTLRQQQQADANEPPDIEIDRELLDADGPAIDETSIIEAHTQDFHL